MLEEIAGLPVHPLIVHATVVLVPLAAVLVALAALLPRVRRWAGVLPALAAAAAVVLVPLTVRSGEALLAQVPGSAELATHMELGEQLLPWALGLLLVGVAVSWRAARERRNRPGGRGSALVLAVAALAVAGGAVVQVVRIGHSGATAVWGG